MILIKLFLNKDIYIADYNAEPIKILLIMVVNQ